MQRGRQKRPGRRPLETTWEDVILQLTWLACERIPELERRLDRLIQEGEALLERTGPAAGHGLEPRDRQAEA